jgi:hypothetical protein
VLKKVVQKSEIRNESRFKDSKIQGCKDSWVQKITRLKQSSQEGRAHTCYWEKCSKLSQNVQKVPNGSKFFTVFGHSEDREVI